MTSKNYTTFTLTFSSSEPLGLQVHKFSETCMAQNATAQSLETQIVVTKIFKGQQGEQVGGLEINDLVTHVSNKKFKGDVDAFISLIGRQRKKKSNASGSLLVASTASFTVTFARVIRTESEVVPKVAKRGRGRPKKVQAVEASKSKKVEDRAPKVAKRGRGRPKQVRAMEASKSKKVEDRVPKVAKRGRGRPKKVRAVEASKSKEVEDQVEAEAEKAEEPKSTPSKKWSNHLPLIGRKVDWKFGEVWYTGVVKDINGKFVTVKYPDEDYQHKIKDCWPKKGRWRYHNSTFN